MHTLCFARQCKHDRDKEEHEMRGQLRPDREIRPIMFGVVALLIVKLVVDLVR